MNKFKKAVLSAGVAAVIASGAGDVKAGEPVVPDTRWNVDCNEILLTLPAGSTGAKVLIWGEFHGELVEVSLLRFEKDEAGNEQFMLWDAWDTNVTQDEYHISKIVWDQGYKYWGDGPNTCGQPNVAPPEVAWPMPQCQEDEDCWDCMTMGNKQCGPELTYAEASYTQRLIDEAPACKKLANMEPGSKKYRRTARRCDRQQAELMR